MRCSYATGSAPAANRSHPITSGTPYLQLQVKLKIRAKFIKFHAHVTDIITHKSFSPATLY
ncbi:hypothetical protein HanRHA438_Chr10g0445061 [Helianthus annuus]|nr:hypothetical protein HanRHA438_Chr10g0445061 [Helianthus annuus]